MDAQADRVIDRLLKERRDVEAANSPTQMAPVDAKEEIKKHAPVGLRRDPELLSLIEKYGKVPEGFLSELVGVKLRQGL
jgi:hypothetical protein